MSALILQVFVKISNFWTFSHYSDSFCALFTFLTVQVSQFVHFKGKRFWRYRFFQEQIMVLTASTLSSRSIWQIFLVFGRYLPIFLQFLDNCRFSKCGIFCFDASLNISTASTPFFLQKNKVFFWFRLCL